jgi:hypothetical protein
MSVRSFSSSQSARTPSNRVLVEETVAELLEYLGEIGA